MAGSSTFLLFLAPRDLAGPAVRSSPDWTMEFWRMEDTRSSVSEAVCAMETRSMMTSAQESRSRRMMSTLPLHFMRLLKSTMRWSR